MTLPKELTTITPLSRYFSLFILIALPFVGFYVGFRYAERFAEYIQSRSSVDQYMLTNQPTNSKDPSTANPDPIPANWKTYTNTAYRFELNYPPDWVFEEETRQEQPSALLNIGFSPEFTSDKPRPIDYVNNASVIS